MLFFKINKYRLYRCRDRLWPLAGFYKNPDILDPAFRQSTDVLAVGDPDVKAALRFIRGNAHRAMQVDDVVKATTVSRRVLEKKFHSLLRRSVYREIRRIRVDLIRQLLLRTDLSISEIARQAGFDGIAHVGRYFRQETAMSLRQYRSQTAPGR